MRYFDWLRNFVIDYSKIKSFHTIFIYSKALSTDNIVIFKGLMIEIMVAYNPIVED